MTGPALWALVALVSMAGSFVQSATGFGYAVTVMALWPLFLPYRTALVVELLAAMALCVVIAVRYRRFMNWRQLLAPCAASFFTNWLGLQIMAGSPDALLRRLLGAALMALAVYFIFFSEKFRVRPTLGAGLAAGAVAGLTAGLFSIGGPPIVVYYLAAFSDKREYTATTQMYFILTSLWLLAQHLWMGNVTPAALGCAGAALGGLAVGAAAGLAVFRALPLKKIKLLVYVFMLVMGLYILIAG